MAPAADGRKGAARPKRKRLSRSGEFERVYREGRSHASRHFVLYSFPRAATAEGEPRLGISVGRKVGGAVQRNRVKRMLRDGFWEQAEGLPDGYDFVVVARPEAGKLAERDGGDAIAVAIRELLDGSGLKPSG